MDARRSARARPCHHCPSNGACFLKGSRNATDWFRALPPHQEGKRDAPSASQRSARGIRKSSRPATLPHGAKRAARPGNLTISLALGVIPHAGFAWPEAGLSAIEGDDGTVIDTPRRGFEPVSRELCAEFE
jgi:hypothetical protein